VAHLNPDQIFWIKDACRRLSSSTGWPIIFRTLEELPAESPLPPGEYQHQEAGLIGGMLCVDLPAEYVVHEDWPAVRQLVHAQAEFINRVISLEDSCNLAARRREQMDEFVSVIANRGGPEENLPRLMELACDVSCSEGSAIFLLSTENRELNLIGQTSREEMSFILPRRPLGADAPDVQASRFHKPAIKQSANSPNVPVLKNDTNHEKHSPTCSGKPRFLPMITMMIAAC